MSYRFDEGSPKHFAQTDPIDAGVERLRDLRTQLLIRWKTVLFLFALFALGGLTLISQLPAIYSSEAVIILKRGDRAGAPGVATSGTSDPFEIKSEVAILQTPEFAKTVVRRLQLTSDPEFQTRTSIVGSILNWAVRGRSGSPSPEQQEALIAQDLISKIRVMHEPESYVVRIRYSNRDPEKAAKIVNVFAETYVQDYQGNPKRSNLATVSWLREYIDVLQNRVAKSEEIIQTYFASKGEGDATTPTHVKKEQEALDLLMSEARAEREKAEMLFKNKVPGSEDQASAVDGQSVAGTNTEIDPKSAVAEKGLGLLRQEVAASKSLIDELMRRARIADMQVNARMPGVEIVSRGTAAFRPVSPNFKVLIPIVLLLSAAAAAAGTLVFAMRQSGFRSLGQAARAGFNAIGTIPRIRAVSRRMLTSNTLKALSDNLKYTDSLCLSLGLDKEKEGGTVILVTSPQGGEGSTLTAAMLAMSLQRIGNRCLLIDGDMFKPSLHKIFDVDGDAGLSNVLRGSDESLHETVRHLANGADILAAGEVGQELLDFTTTRRLGNFFAVLRQQYDSIVIDTSPVLEKSDAALLAAYADHCLLVAKWNASSKRVVTQANNILAQRCRYAPELILSQVNYSQMYQFEEGRREGNIAAMPWTSHEEAVLMAQGGMAHAGGVVGGGVAPNNAHAEPEYTVVSDPVAENGAGHAAFSDRLSSNQAANDAGSVVDHGHDDRLSSKELKSAIMSQLQRRRNN